MSTFAGRVTASRGGKNGLEKTITKQMLFSKVLVRNSSYKYFFFACYSNHIGPYRNRNTHNYG